VGRPLISAHFQFKRWPLVALKSGGTLPPLYKVGVRVPLVPTKITPMLPAPSRYADNDRHHSFQRETFQKNFLLAKFMALQITGFLRVFISYFKLFDCIFVSGWSSAAISSIVIITIIIIIF